MTDEAPAYEYRLVMSLGPGVEWEAGEIRSPWLQPSDADLEAMKDLAEQSAAFRPDDGGHVSLDTDDGTWWCLPLRSVTGYRLERREAKPPEQRRAEALGVAEE